MSNSPTKPNQARDQGGAVYGGNGKYNLKTNTTAKIVAGPIYFHQVVVGKAGSADWSVAIYDGVDNTGELISTCDFNAGGTYPFNCAMYEGIYVVSSGTTPGDVTFIYTDPALP